MKNIRLFLGCFILLFLSCNDDNSITNESLSVSSKKGIDNKVDKEEYNKYLWDVMSDYYYHAYDVPFLDYYSQSNAYNWIENNDKSPSEFYYTKLVAPIDRFSYIQSKEEYEKQQSNTYKSSGAIFGYVKYSEHHKKLLAFVQYVEPNSSAWRKGIKRGDIIYRINGRRITNENKYELTKPEWIYVDFARINDSGRVLADTSRKSVYLYQTEDSFNSVHKYKTLNINGNKIGYLHYTAYVSKFNPDLKKALSSFKSQGIDYLVLDLRYNGGGEDNASVVLASSIAGNRVSKDDKLFIDKNRDGYEEFVLKFKRSSIGLNIKTLYVLLGKDSYSASEQVTYGLKPYMNVVTIGESTGGKNTVMYYDKYNNSSNFYNGWSAAVIYAKSENSNGVSVPDTGIIPDYVLNEASLFNLKSMKSLGDPEELLFNKAINLITPIKKSFSKVSISPALKAGKLIGASDDPYKWRKIRKSNYKRN